MEEPPKETKTEKMKRLAGFVMAGRFMAITTIALLAMIVPYAMIAFLFVTTGATELLTPLTSLHEGMKTIAIMVIGAMLNANGQEDNKQKQQAQEPAIKPIKVT